jgi:hypothetical protein
MLPASFRAGTMTETVCAGVGVLDRVRAVWKIVRERKGKERKRRSEKSVDPSIQTKQRNRTDDPLFRVNDFQVRKIEKTSHVGCAERVRHRLPRLQIQETRELEYRIPGCVVEIQDQAMYAYCLYVALMESADCYSEE